MADVIQVTQKTAVSGRSVAARRKPVTLDIAVLYGGIGPEREVSLNSGAAVADALTRRGHSVELCDITPDRLDILESVGDMAFIVLHGAFGEDGTVQRELMRRGVLFCGADETASALAMDKVATKRLCVGIGVPTPPFVSVTAAESQQELERVASSIQLPVVVKPTDSGSSVDTFMCRTVETLRQALDRVTGRYGRALVEGLIQGPELTVGMLDQTALPVCQIRTRREFYDYQAKYIDDDTEYLFDIDLPDRLLERVQALSVQIFAALNCQDFGRVDWMVDGTTGEPFFLEVNTIPGFTSHSLLPKAAARVGVSFDDLCQRIVDLTMKRKRLD